MMLPIVSNSLVYKDEFMLADNFNSPFDIETAARFMNSSHPFKINFTMALLCFKGSIRIRLNLEEHLLQTNDVLTILPGYIGECLEISRDCKIVLIAYTWKRRFGESSATTYSIAVFNRITKFPLLRMQPGKMEEIMAIYRLMRRRMQDTGFQYTGEALGGYMQVLASIFYQRVHEDLEQTPEPEAGNRQEVLFKKFMELLQEHYTKERSVAFYAGKMCLTPKYLSISVRKASGRHAGEWIRELVILEAKALLKSREYTVQQVCDMLNFANPSFFGKYFKAATGCSPRKYMLE